MLRRHGRRSPLMRAVLLGLVMLSAPLLAASGAQGSAQSNPYSPQCPGLWDAVGRTYPVAMAPGGPYAIIGMEIGEFLGDGPSPQALTCISDKLSVLHSRWGSMQTTSAGIDLPHFQATEFGHAAQIEYGFWRSVDATTGITNISLLFGRNNHLVTLLFQADAEWTNQYVDSTAFAIWTALGGFQVGTPTASDQFTNSGLWSVLALPPTMTYAQSSDYLSAMFAGFDDIGRTTTPALLAGQSHVSVDLFDPLAGSESTQVTVDGLTQDMELSVVLVGPSAEISPFGICGGVGTYADLQLGAPVTVRNMAGAIVAQGPDWPARKGTDFRGDTCSGTVTVEDVPFGSESYTVWIRDTIVATTSPPGSQYVWLVSIVI